MLKAIVIGAERYITNLDEQRVVVSWNALWMVPKFVRDSPPHRRESSIIWLPSNIAVLPVDRLETLQTPGSEPALTIAIRWMQFAGTRKSTKTFRAETSNIIARLNGEAWLVPDQNLKILTHRNEFLDLNKYDKFKLPELIGDDNMKKLLATAKSKLRKLLK